MMDARSTSIVAYLTWIGLLIAFVAGDKEGAKFHLNQSIVIFLFGFLSVIPFIGWIWSLFIAVCWIMGFISALSGTEKRVPLIGNVVLFR